MIFGDNTREIPVIEVYYKEKLIGKFVDMHTARNQLGVLADKVSYNFNIIVNEKTNSELFWKLIEKGFVLNSKIR